MEIRKNREDTILARGWYEMFSRYAGDLCPGRYTPEFCQVLAEQAYQILDRAQEKQSVIVAHNYLYPEFHHLAEMIGDSLGLSRFVKEKRAARVDFQGVYFMAATAKIIAGKYTRVFVSGTPDELGCSLVSGTDYRWIEKWKERYPDGILISYINSDAYIKSISDYVCTSRNTDKIIMKAARDFPGRRILLLPDKFLGFVMRARAMEQDPTLDPDMIDVYQHSFNGQHASCYVHEEIGENAVEKALDQYPDAELMIHPECGCASFCLYKLQQGKIPNGKAYFLSTEQMVHHAKRSLQKRFIVATEKGMVYRLRREMPEKTFIPVSLKAECKYMKANTLEKLLVSLTCDRWEIVICDDCCDPKQPRVTDSTIHIPCSTARKARVGIERMLTIV